MITKIISKVQQVKIYDLKNEGCCSPLRSSSPDKASTSMGNQIFPKHGVHCSQDKENPIAIVTNTDMSNNERDGALANEKQNPEFISISDVSHSQGDDVLENVHSCQQVSQKGRSDQSRPSFNFELPLMTDQHYSPPATSCQQEKQNPNFIVMDNDVCNNQRNGVLSNEREKQIPNLISLNNDVCNNQGDGALVDNDCSNQLSSICDLASTSSGDQCSSPSTSCSPQMIQRHTFIDIGSDNGCSNQLRPICDLACTSLGDQYSSPSASCSPQVGQRLNFIDLSSDDNEDEYTLEDCVMKREISKLRKENNNLKKETKEKERKLSEATKIEEENTKLRKEVESLKHQNLLHLSAFNIVSRLNSVVFSEIADEVLGTN
ncbi:hypothetical protein Leryth_022697 [Lithospermum erythrorhizon]|nr:hypothetical protein Leryth_022697 [Lithospermum erythrorhizon]